MKLYIETLLKKPVTIILIRNFSFWGDLSKFFLCNFFCYTVKNTLFLEIIKTLKCTKSYYLWINKHVENENIQICPLNLTARYIIMSFDEIWSFRVVSLHLYFSNGNGKLRCDWITRDHGLMQSKCRLW